MNGPDLLVILDNGTTLKCQVKTAAKTCDKGRYHFRVRRGRHHNLKYDDAELDFYAFVALDMRICLFRKLSEVSCVSVKFRPVHFSLQAETDGLHNILKDYNEC